MTLLVILIVIGLQRYLNFGEQIPRLRWFKRYLLWTQSIFKKTAFWHEIVGIIIILLPIILVSGVLQWLLHGWLFGIFKFIFDLIVLWYCLDAYQLKHELADYFSAMVREDKVASHDHGIKFVRSETAKARGDITGGGLANTARTITYEIFIRSNEHLFAILFWFIVLGPVGAITYYLTVAIRDNAAVQNSEFIELLIPTTKVFGVLDWVPVRILSLSYALVGNFVAGFNYFRQNFLIGIQRTQEFAINAGFAALDGEHIDVIHADAEENKNALALVDRAVYVWIVAVAIFTLGGWL